MGAASRNYFVSVQDSNNYFLTSDPPGKLFGTLIKCDKQREGVVFYLYSVSVPLALVTSHFINGYHDNQQF